MKVLTAAEMREVDRLTTERFGIPSLQLMEAAGKAVADEVRTLGLAPHAAESRKIAVLCGKGNNGGDGFVAARYLLTGGQRRQVYLFASPEELRGDAGVNYQRWTEAGGNVTLVREEGAWEKVWPEIAGADVIVDALLGTGLRGGATGLPAQAIEDLNRFSRNATAPVPGLIIAVDTPSGLPSDSEAAQGPVLRAHVTVTFTAPKIGQLVSRDAACCGALRVKPIGSPQALVEQIGKSAVRWAGAEEFASLPLIRTVDAHKGTYGHALIVAGSLGKSGAAILAGQGCLRAGAGLTTIATPDVVLPIVAAGQPELMTEPLASTAAGTVGAGNFEDGRFARILEGKTVLAVGPGLGTERETQEFIRKIVCETPMPVILDADGLNAFAEHAELLRKRKSPFLAITPHPGEMARLLGSTSAAVQGDRIKAALEAAQRWNVHVVLKGFHTIIAAPDGQVWVNTTGSAGLAKGGTGDVLTGVLTGLTAQFGTREWMRTLALGVYLHGVAAELREPGVDDSALLAGDVGSAIPRARAALIEEIRRGG
jgi:ADP-dependent NAD(P)H-hydrate dehydratase / NAD(P)H-hydrate epimerase